jgi:probable selenium-dependent hydroxylase accessory protein YqeC
VKILLNSILGVKDGDVISIVGSGGKTSTMFRIAKGLLEKKVLVTTTTKILVPDKSDYDFLCIGDEGVKNAAASSIPGIYVAGEYIDANNKIIGFEKKAESLSRFFDLCVCEADGSNRKNLKGWRDYEPVVLSNSTMTIGVINFKLIGQSANEANIHRLEEFIKISNVAENEEITFMHIKNVIFNEKGLFKGALGQKVLFVNMLDDEHEYHKAVSLLSDIDRNFFHKIILGSIRHDCYYEF